MSVERGKRLAYLDLPQLALRASQSALVMRPTRLNCMAFLHHPKIPCESRLRVHKPGLILSYQMRDRSVRKRVRRASFQGAGAKRGDRPRSNFGHLVPADPPLARIQRHERVSNPLHLRDRILTGEERAICHEMRSCIRSVIVDGCSLEYLTRLASAFFITLIRSIGFLSRLLYDSTPALVAINCEAQ
jgi:hypothetical protein